MGRDSKPAGWLDLPYQQLAIIPELEAFRDELLKEGFTDAFVLGMGGSSLAPEVISHSIASTVAEAWAEAKNY